MRVDYRKSFRASICMVSALRGFHNKDKQGRQEYLESKELFKGIFLLYYKRSELVIAVDGCLITASYGQDILVVSCPNAYFLVHVCDKTIAAYSLLSGRITKTGVTTRSEVFIYNSRVYCEPKIDDVVCGLSI